MQEHRASKATEALKKMLPSYASNQEQQILAEDLVPGDIMLIEEGDKISADARLLTSSDLQVNQSTLTGESKIANLTQTMKVEQSPLEKELDLLTKQVSIIAVSIGVSFFLATIFFVKEPFAKAFIFSLGMIEGKYSIIQVKVDSRSKAINKSLTELVLPVNAVLIAIYRGKDVIIPHGDTVINSGDNILAFTDEDAEAEINSLFGS